MIALSKRVVFVLGIVLASLLLISFVHLSTVLENVPLSFHEASDTASSAAAYNDTVFLKAPFDHPSLAAEMSEMRKSGLDMTKVATLVDTRATPKLIPVLLHFIAALPAEWPFRIYHGPDNYAMLMSSSALRRHIDSRKVTLVPITIDFAGPWGWGLVGDFLTSRGFYENQAPARHILFFQLDSILCSNSRASINDFLEWDFIGAPINPFMRGEEWKQPGQVWMNGGLSLRNRDAMLRVIADGEARDEPFPKHPFPADDIWFSERLYRLGGTIPSEEVAGSFSAETMYYEKPFGVHSFWHWLSPENQREIEAWCPEYVLVKKTPQELTDEEAAEEAKKAQATGLPAVKDSDAARTND